MKDVYPLILLTTIIIKINSYGLFFYSLNHREAFQVIQLKASKSSNSIVGPYGSLKVTISTFLSHPILNSIKKSWTVNIRLSNGSNFQDDSLMSTFRMQLSLQRIRSREKSCKESINLCPSVNDRKCHQGQQHQKILHQESKQVEAIQEQNPFQISFEF